jgi:hypothetical protein
MEIKRTRTYLFLLCFLLAVVSCQSSDSSMKKWQPYYQEKNAKVYEEKVMLESRGIIEFYLDEHTGFDSYSINMYHADTLRRYFTMTNHLNNTLLIYDYDRPAEVHHVIPLVKDAEQNVGRLSRGHGHIILNKDSIYLYNSNTAFLYLMDWDGNIKEKTKLHELTGTTPESGRPTMSSMAPMIHADGYLYIPCEVNAQLEHSIKANLVLKYHLATNSFEFISPFTDLYNQANWGPLFNYKVTFAYHPQRNSLILNYPIDPYLYDYDLTENRVKDQSFAGSSLINGIPPMHKDVYYVKDMEVFKLNEERKQYGWTTSTQPYVLYDPYQNLLYRIAYIRPTPEAFAKKQTAPLISLKKSAN